MDVRAMARAERYAIHFQGVACRRGRRSDTLRESSLPYGFRVIPMSSREPLWVPEGGYVFLCIPDAP
eukprot:6169148-Pyramimonas_sp.AAC.1